MSSGRNRVLVVDNLADAADCLAMLLELWGYDTQVCYDGYAALDLVRTYRPQVVLLDVGMPGLDGFEVARRLRDRPECVSTALIAITGYADANNRSRAREAGFDHYLLKPVEPDFLQELLEGVTSDAACSMALAGPPEDGDNWGTPSFPSIVSACFASGQLLTQPLSSLQKVCGTS